MDCISRILFRVVPAPDAKTAKFILIVLTALFAFAKSHASANEDTLNIMALPISPALLSPQQLVNSIVQFNESATSDMAWHDSDSFVRLYKEKLYSMQVSPDDRCHALASLKDQQLLHFYDELNTPNFEPLVKCLENLSVRMNSYLTDRTDTLAQNYKALARNTLTRCSDRSAAQFGPTQTMISSVDVKSILFGDDHPECGITLTFDDGPHPHLTEKLLAILKNQNLLVNFFVLGERVQQNRDVLKMSYTAGHMIGNHTQSHLDLRKLSFENATNEIEAGYNQIQEAIGEYFPQFRFPYGASTKTLRAYLKHFGRVEFYWNIDTRDWAIKDPVELFKYSLVQIEKVQKGIALYHDIQPQTIAMMPYLLESLRDAGYTPYVIRPKPRE